MEDRLDEINEAFKERDEEGDGEIPVDGFWEVIGSLDSEIQEFIEYMMFRLSDSVNSVNYYTFLEMIGDDFLIDKSPYEDTNEYQASDETSEDD